MILAGDIGGTNARLAYFEVEQGRLKLVAQQTYSSRESSGLDEIVTKFVACQPIKRDIACFGVAGPVRNGRVETSNLPWMVDSAQLAGELGLPKALLINDLEANAWGIAELEGGHLVALNQVKAPVGGNQAVVAAGTGLGEAGLFWNGEK